MGEETIFDKILRKEIPAQVVYEDDHVFAFRDINPVAPTHVLVIPKKKRKDTSDLGSASSEEIAVFLRGITKTASVLGLEENGYRIVMNNGADAQQSVAYLHAHIIGGRSLGWPPG